MRAIQVSKIGPPEVLEPVELPRPTPKPDEALIELKAIGVNFIDVYFREGRYPAKLPFIPGQEASGIVVEAGAEAKGVKVGDRVAFTGAFGSYAQFQAVAAHSLIKIPDSIHFRQAAAVMLQGMTAHYLTRNSYAIQRGDTVLIHAAAGGVGLLLVQMAKQLGATVIAAAGTVEKAELAREAGADHTIVYASQDFEAETRILTGGRGVNAVYDGVGKDTFDRDLNVLRPRGMLVLYGGSSGAVAPFDPMILSRKGSLSLTRPTLAHFIATREELEQRANDVLGAIASGVLKLRLKHDYPLEAAAQAHRDLEARRTTGKVLLIP
jgi:NADPH2:quinone reductase